VLSDTTTPNITQLRNKGAGYYQEQELVGKLAPGWESQNPTAGFRVPGQEYEGPRNSLIWQVMNNVQPKSYTDFVAREHDIDYLTDDEPILADIKAIYKSDWSLPGWIMKLGLGARAIADILLLETPYHKYTHFNSSYTGSKSNDILLQNVLRNHIAKTPGGASTRW
jgi:hypothetical protein